MVRCLACGASDSRRVCPVALRPGLLRKHGQIGKSQKLSSMTRPARAITHLIHEVRPDRTNAWRFFSGGGTLSSSDRVSCALSLFVSARFTLVWLISTEMPRLRGVFYCTLPRIAFVELRRAFPSRRRSFDARVGRVARRAFSTVLSSRIRLTRRCNAASRFIS